ncbi:hypothetical protein [Corynebacterium hindlerae]|uniref:hypothetical protein n=1 Tax=Corynebacterium hindlerae TaxID=699041 RepID=UPI003AB1049E
MLVIAFGVFVKWLPSYPHVGGTAFSHDIDGSITLHVYACPGEEVREITVVGGMYDGPNGSHNPDWVHLTRDDAMTGYFTVNLNDPDGWREEVATNIPTDPEKYLIAKGAPEAQFFRKGKLIRPVSLQLKELQAWPAGELVRDLWEAPPIGTTREKLEEHCTKN